MIERFEDLKAWQKSRKLNKNIFNSTKKNPFVKDYALKYQIRKASNSIMLNIAEGFGRRTDKEFRHFLFIAHGSVAEVQSALYIALDCEYLTEKEFDIHYDKADEVSKIISGLIKYLNGEKEKDDNIEPENDIRT